MISVLIVDDHALFRAGLRSRLELEHDITSVGEAATAEEAVGKARSLQPDLVLLDLLLPGTSGHEAIPKLAKVSPGSRGGSSLPARPQPVRQAFGRGSPGMFPSAHPTSSLSRPSGRLLPGVYSPLIGGQAGGARARSAALEPLSTLA